MPLHKPDPSYVLRISEPALIQLCLSGLEAYSISHLRKGPRLQLETYGMLWGHAADLPNGRTLYAVEMASVDTSARMNHSMVTPNDDALELKRDLMTSFWPHLEFLGDFHTHPYPQGTDVAGERLYQFSDADRSAIEESPEFWQRHRYRIGLVLTITTLRRASSRMHKWLEDSAIEFTLGNYRLWLKAYVAFAHNGGLQLTSDDDSRVLLDCPALIGLQGEYTEFGRARTGPGPRHRVGEVAMTLESKNRDKLG